eukprot:Selendium_serpulae@DN5409_c0_g1_i1.p2
MPDPHHRHVMVSGESQADNYRHCEETNQRFAVGLFSILMGDSKQTRSIEIAGQSFDAGFFGISLAGDAGSQSNPFRPGLPIYRPTPHVGSLCLMTGRESAPVWALVTKICQRSF